MLLCYVAVVRMDGFKLDVEQLVDQYLVTVTALWNSYGQVEEERTKRLETVVHHLTVGLAASIQQEKQFKQDLEDKLDQNVGRVREMECELGLEPFEV